MAEMKSLILANVSRAIPYYPELNTLTKSVTASLLMVQLEYWFSKTNGRNFYKFLEGCEHPSYVPGDGWLEEIGFSKKEFKNAFSKIGITYVSKKEYDQASDKFEGMYYLSYRDRVKGLTFYQRNNELLDQVLTNWATKSDSTEVPKGVLRKLPKGTYGDEQRELTEGTNGNLRTEPKGTYVSAERAFPLSVDYSVDYQETKQKTTQESTHNSGSNEPERTRRTQVPYEDIIFEYNKICISLPQVQQVSDKRKKAMRTMWKYANGDIDILRTLFYKTESSDFLAGRKKEWKANFDWIMRENQAIAILEGQYDNSLKASVGTVTSQLMSKGMQEFINGDGDF
ncbi:hypothetical protein PBV87_15415 [Niameybacter massiliensis]|uniref:Uncharacterized protein n=1 Tax=Holtiella tumoricola TaxID=3018743 RepID=A0AA42DPQ6_9FIRM|nr:hypothetical protein [Holtiella tumoricola]MDA3732865.1 hypothetical protein [Holtiella tumoricola]